jgi:catechol 2,3-dioxygenase-like lactoylglutathione lyase family enzyme
VLNEAKAYSGFSTDDIEAAKRFYADTLGVTVTEDNGMLTLALGGGQRVLVYAKDDHQPASYTCLNFQVDDVDRTVTDLTARGVTFERYEGFEQDDKGIMRQWGPPIAWFKDPAGNVLAVIEEA